MRIVLDGEKINSEEDFHRQISALLDFGEYYGRNLNALWDRLTVDVLRPVNLVWINSDLSRSRLGDDVFDEIVSVLDDVMRWDIEHNLEEKFTFSLA